MKDVPPEMQSGKLPSCPFSAHYERLLEDLDKKSASPHDEESLFADNAQDRQLLLQLQAHLPGCPTCTVILARTRAQRFWQRQQFRRFLSESEQKVPSSTTRIMQALAHEPKPFSETRAASNGHKRQSEGEEVSPIVFVQRQRPMQRSSRFVQNMLAFVAVLAVILASFNLFGHVLVFHATPRSGASITAQKTSAIASVLHAATWSSVIIAQRKGRQKIISSIDPITGKSAVLASSDSPDATMLNGVSHDGYQVLYHVFDGDRTRYYLRPFTQNTILYTTNGKGGQAIWNTDDSSVFISTSEGVEQVDVNSHRATLAVSAVKAPDLRFYRDGYLYYVASANAGASMWLNRIALAQGNIASVTEGFCTLSYDFWPSPGGSTVYYRCKDQTALYAITNDGTGARMVRADAGRMIGYTAQGEPLTLVKTGTAFQVIKLGVDALHDQTIVADIAPGASDLTVDSIAIAPYGFSLMALAHYPDGSGKLWYDDLIHHTQHVISASFNVQLASSLQVGGWSRLQVSAGG